MENYEIRYCKLSEVDKLQQFIDKYWKKNHILAHNKELLDYQHKNTLENRYNFVVAHNVVTNELMLFLVSYLEINMIPLIKIKIYGSPFGKKMKNNYLEVWEKIT